MTKITSVFKLSFAENPEMIKIISGFSAKLSLNTEVILVILALFSPQPRSWSQFLIVIIEYYIN